MRSVCSVVVGLTLLAGSIQPFAGLPPAGAAPVPPPFPSHVTALGDSITLAFNSGAPGSSPAHSWATGTDATVNSVAQRAAAATRVNLAQVGARMSDLSAQAALVNPTTQFVTIELGANDLCKSDISLMTSVADFQTSLTNGLNTLTATAPNATIYLVSIPDVYRLWAQLHDVTAARAAWAGIGLCQSLLANPLSFAPADEARREAFRARNIAFNTTLATVCAGYAKCKTDGNRVFNIEPDAAPVSTVDYFHPSHAGQAVLAAAAWGPDTIGGRNLIIGTGSVDLTWDGGTLQNGYVLLRYNTATAEANLIPLGGDATTYADTTATSGVVYCYVLAILVASNPSPSLSDLLCALPGLGSGTTRPQGFVLSLGGTSSAGMTWSPPVGGADSYLLQRIPLDGTPPSAVPLTEEFAEEPVAAAGTCFQVIAFKGAGFGTSDVLCGVPGVSTLGLGRASIAAAAALEAVADRLGGSALGHRGG